jgi:sugar O-acyltransferase (sialic acid O-acetyltransferase NeuD family)
LRILDYSVLGVDEDLPRLLGEYRNAVIAVGQIKSPEPRMHLFDLVKQFGGKLPVIVSPHAYVSPHVKLGAGTIVMHRAVVNAGAVVGENCIINSQSLVEHNAFIGDHCHIATAAIINSGVHMGAGTFLGSNASVRQCVNIGERCVIGMGQQVFADCEAGVCMP